ncbi:MAG: hypothetical protein Q7S65_04580 [Nanoarchaeota archaeon]|nr:hypothetical protein [Nanoarchaeota archaeon]
MAFIRVKTIKGNRYAYLVENTWKKRKGASRQKVGKYLGKVVALERKGSESFLGAIPETKEGIVLALVEHELLMHGFEKRGELLVQEARCFSLPLKRFLNSKGLEANLVAEMNEGFLCKETLASLLRFKAKKDDEHDNAVELAKAFLETGLKVPHPFFVAYFEKV